MGSELKHEIYTLIHQLMELDTRVVSYVMLIVVVLIVLDDVLRAIKAQQKKSGVYASKAMSVHVDGAKKHKAKTYISEIQGISGRPDAVLHENGFFIPVERKAIGNKIRDRHIAQLLVYMRLIEEFEGKKPPYGYLVLGKSARKVKIYNSTERQEWLSKQLQEMREVVESGERPEGKPHPRKCQKCRVKEHCVTRLSQLGSDAQNGKLVKIGTRVV